MNTVLRNFMGSRLAHQLLYRLVRAYAATYRLTVAGETEWMAHLRGGGRVLLCAWHQQFFAAIRHFRNYRSYNPALMISRSRDGEIIAGVAALTGWKPVRGSSSRGGRSALQEMIGRLRRDRLAGHIVDGPRGPAGIVKPGVIRLALEAGAVIVPFYVEADRAWFFNSWDRFFIPKPFARVNLRFDRMIFPAAPETDADFEDQRRTLETVMREQLRSGN